MKTIPPTCPEPETGRKYWRSLDQLAETPEFRQWVEREFPAGASEWTDPVSRRHFVKIMSASFLLAGLGLARRGCRRPEEKILAVCKSRRITFTACRNFSRRRCPRAAARFRWWSKSNDGRPTKIEGNRRSSGQQRRHGSLGAGFDPESVRSGSRDAFHEADGNDRHAGSRRWMRWMSCRRKLQANGGQGLAFLLERSSSPSRLRLQKRDQRKISEGADGSFTNRWTWTCIVARHRRLSANRSSRITSSIRRR